MSESNKTSYLTSKDVQEILRLLEASTFNTLELEIGDLRLRLQRGAVAATAPALRVAKPPLPAPAVLPSTLNGAHAEAVQPAPGTVEIRASTPGRFYRAPRPGEAPFVDVGALVTPQTTVGIIEVMKLMSGVLAGVEGEIREICVENGAAVEYDQVLMRVARPLTAERSAGLSDGAHRAG